MAGDEKAPPVDSGEALITYNGRTHSELGISPQGAWVADGWLPRMPDTFEELDGFLLTVPKNRVVQRDGIHFQGQRYLAPALAPFVGHTITIRYDPRWLCQVDSLPGSRFDSLPPRFWFVICCWVWARR